MKSPYWHITLLQDVFNQLGMIHSSKQAFSKAVELLQQAEELYKAWVAAIPTDQIKNMTLQDVKEGTESPHHTGSQVSLATPTARMQQVAKDKYAHTLFYLAQLFDLLDDRAQSATYCAGTLSVQLELGVEDYLQWTTNCQQLSGYFISSEEVAVAEHLLTCSDVAFLRIPNPASVESAEDAASHRESTQNPYSEKYEALKADIALSWAKLFSKRLALSVRVQDEPGYSLQPSISSLPENLRFVELDADKLENLHWDGGLAKSMEEAKELFNHGIKKLRDALEFYQLNGHVIMHCNIALEISELFRWLADFESDGHKKCVLHKTRAKRLVTVLRELNAEAWPEVCNAMRLDIATAHRTIAEIKFDEKRPFDKVAAAAREAIPYFESYISSFKVNGKLPETLKGEDVGDMYITAVFGLARVVSRLDPPINKGNIESTENLRRAVDLYRYCAQFIRRNKIKSKYSMADRCLELAKLISENAQMLQVAVDRERRSRS